MGIRFHCPSGHKLNVKAFLAGKRAICPKCGAKVVVPLASETEEVLGDDGKHAAGSAILSQDPVSAIESAGPTNANVGGASIVQGSTQAAASTSSPGTATANLSAATGAIGSSNQATSGNGASHVDAIDEAPSAVWYVRPPGAGQYGPATASVMRSWLAEGRVGATSLVWRAGWPEWRSAVEVFPQLSAAMAPALATATPLISALDDELPVGQPIGAAVAGSPLGFSSEPVATRRLRRKRSNNVTIIASVVLVVVAVVLVVVLIMVLRNQSEATAQGPPPLRHFT